MAAPRDGATGRGLHWQGTILYPLALVAMFLAGQLLLGALGVPPSQRAAPAAVPALLALLLTLPWRLRRAWNVDHPWRSLGVRGAAPSLGLALLGGLSRAALLLGLVIAGLAMAGALTWQPRLSLELLANALLLGLGVGFAEELLFRGWLLGELSLLIGGRRAVWLQAGLFSLVHSRFTLQPTLLVGLLGGLLLFGLALALQRRADGGVLWGAVGLHGGLVGGWFLLNQGVVIVDPAAPGWLTGPANPIGGALGWLGLGLLVLALRPSWPRPCR